MKGFVVEADNDYYVVTGSSDNMDLKAYSFSTIDAKEFKCTELKPSNIKRIMDNNSFTNYIEVIEKVSTAEGQYRVYEVGNGYNLEICYRGNRYNLSHLSTEQLDTVIEVLDNFNFYDRSE